MPETLTIRRVSQADKQIRAFDIRQSRCYYLTNLFERYVAPSLARQMMIEWARLPLALFSVQSEGLLYLG